MMKILVKNKDLGELFNQGYGDFTVCYFYGDNDETELYTAPEVMGYYEPVTFYKKLKDIVEDIWYKIVGDVDLKVGKDESKNNPYVWTSCKKQLKEEERC